LFVMPTTGDRMPTDKFIAALGKAVAARWDDLPVEVQQTLFEAAIESVGEGSRGKLSVYLHGGLGQGSCSQGAGCPSPILHPNRRMLR
jgi:hypothetical protein